MPIEPADLHSPRLLPSSSSDISIPSSAAFHPYSRRSAETSTYQGPTPVIAYAIVVICVLISIACCFWVARKHVLRKMEETTKLFPSSNLESRFSVVSKEAHVVDRTTLQDPSTNYSANVTSSQPFQANSTRIPTPSWWEVRRALPLPPIPNAPPDASDSFTQPFRRQRRHRTRRIERDGGVRLAEGPFVPSGYRPCSRATIVSLATEDSAAGSAETLPPLYGWCGSSEDMQTSRAMDIDDPDGLVPIPLNESPHGQSISLALPAARMALKSYP